MNNWNYIETEYKTYISQIRIEVVNIINIVNIILSINGDSSGEIFINHLHSYEASLDIASLVLSSILITANMLLIKAAEIVEKTDDIWLAKLSDIEHFASQEFLGNVDFDLSIFTQIAENRDASISIYGKMPGISIVLI